MKLTIVVCMFFLTAAANGQTTLTEMFKDLHSPDPKVRDAANRMGPLVLDRALPTIETETRVICDALGDRDEAIRQDSSAILNTISAVYQQKDAVVTACVPQLLKTASDPVDQIRENSVGALAIKAGSPPAEAAPVFEAALLDKLDSVKQFGAAGLVRLAAGADTAGIQALNQRLLSEQNPETKHALLYGMAMARTPHPALAALASRLIADPDPEVQNAAILVVETLNTDKARALNELANYKSSPLLSPQAKQMLNGAVTRLQAATH